MVVPLREPSQWVRRKHLATFVISQAAMDAGAVFNTVSAVASSPANSNNVTDTSDNGQDGDGNTIDDQTKTEFNIVSNLRVSKTALVQDVNSNTINDVEHYRLFHCCDQHRLG